MNPRLMTENQRAVCNRDCRLENFAAERSNVAYSLVMRRGVVDKWIDRELELWAALKEQVRSMRSRVASGQRHAR